MTFNDWRKEGVYVIEYWACAVFADNPILVVLIHNKYEGFKVAGAVRVAQLVFALSAVRYDQLFGQYQPRVQREV